MRNIFIEGVRSAFIRIIRMIVYIILGLIIFYVIGLFTNKKVHAMTRKESFTPTMDAYSWSGTLSSGGSASKTFTYSTPLQNTNHYDYLLIRFREMSFTYQWEYSSEDYACRHYNISHGYVQNQFVDTELTCDQWYYNDTDVLKEGSLTITATIRQDANISNSCYLSDNMKGFLICEMPDTASSIEINIRQRGYTAVNYNIDFFARQYFYNEESTEIVNGLNGVQQQQQQTITIIQQQLDEQEQQNQYMQSDNVISSTTSMTTSITTMTDEISQRLTGASELTQIVLAPLALLTGLATDTCAPLVLQVPFVNYTANLPCMKPVFNQYFNGLYSIFTTIISAIMTYWISVKTFSLIKDILDCDNDRIEVIDL